MSLHTDLETLFRQILERDDLQLRDDMAAGVTDGWDSLAHINLMVAIEETFGVRFDMSAYAALQDVRSIKRALSDRLDAQVSASIHGD